MYYAPQAKSVMTIDSSLIMNEVIGARRACMERAGNEFVATKSRGSIVEISVFALNLEQHV